MNLLRYLLNTAPDEVALGGGGDLTPLASKGFTIGCATTYTLGRTVCPGIEPLILNFD